MGYEVKWTVPEHSAPPSLDGIKHKLQIVGGTSGARCAVTIACILEFPQCFMITCDNGRGGAANCAQHLGTLSQAKRDAESTLRDMGWQLSMIG